MNIKIPEEDKEMKQCIERKTPETLDGGGLPKHLHRHLKVV